MTEPTKLVPVSEKCISISYSILLIDNLSNLGREGETISGSKVKRWKKYQGGSMAKVITYFFIIDYFW